MNQKAQLGMMIGAVLLVVGGFTGCSMCCGPYDYHYPTFGGKHQRVDPEFGRVGSIFSDPLAGYNGPSADSNLEPSPELESRGDSLDSDGEDMDRGSDDDSDGDLERLPSLESVNETAARYQRFGR